MGLYTQITYSTYGTHWHENLFYSHFLSLPLFLPFFPSLIAQFRQFFESPLVQLSPLSFEPFPPPKNADTNGWPSFGSIMSPLSKTSMFVPKQLLMLIANALTQYACIRGVNFLGARTSALGVTIVLNIRKLVSLFLSIWLFGNRLPPGVLTGAAVVFTSAGVWAWEGQRKGGTKAHKKG